MNRVEKHPTGFDVARWSIAVALVCVSSSLGSCEGLANNGSSTNSTNPGKAPQSKLSPHADSRAVAADEYIVDNVVSREQAACGVAVDQEVGGVRTRAILSSQGDQADVLNCLLDQREFDLVLQYVLTLWSNGRREDALFWNRKLADRVLRQHGASTESTPDELGRLPMAPHLSLIARIFVDIAREGGRMSPAELAKWQALLEGQVEQERRAAQGGSND